MSQHVMVTSDLISSLENFKKLKELSMHPSRHPARQCLMAVVSDPNPVVTISHLASALKVGQQTARNRAHEAISLGLMKDLGNGGKGSQMMLAATPGAANINPYTRQLRNMADDIETRFHIKPY